MRTVPTSAMLVLSLLALAAGPKVEKAAAPRPTALLGDDGKPVQGVRLTRGDMRAVVHGNLAQATLTLTFANDLPRVLGGNLTFALPEGATVTGYGLEINGTLVDGVAVEKERARIIYENEIHKRVDPGLVEHVQGNAFRTRLYPVPANGTRSIRIEYVTQVEQGKDGCALALPLNLGDALDELSLRIEAPDAAVSPTIEAGGIDGLTFVKAAHGFTAAASVKKAKSAEELVVGLPQLPAKSVAVEKRLKYPRTVEELQGGARLDAAPEFDHYFVVTDTPTPGPRQMIVLKNHRVGLVWDASLSRGKTDHARELKLLGGILNRLGNPQVDLILLRNDLEVRPALGGDAAGSAKLIAALGDLPYDGATNLGSLILPKNVADYPQCTRQALPAADYDLFLLFSDGLGNLGADRPLRAEAPVYAMSDDLQANYPLLRAMCQESGGGYFNLKRATDEQVIAGVGDAPLSLVSIECDPREIAEVNPPAGTPVAGRFTLSGKLLVREAKLTLHYGYGKEVAASETFTITSADAAEGSLLPRFWAQQKVAALSLFPEKNAEAIAQLGKQFNLVTAGSSLLVLETVDQYVQYRVVPPPTRPEIYREFLARVEQDRVQEARTQEQKLQEVAALWNERVKWWEQEHKYPANLKVKREPLKNEEVAALEGNHASPGPAFATNRAFGRAPESAAPAPVGRERGAAAGARNLLGSHPDSPLVPPPAGAATEDRAAYKAKELMEARQEVTLITSDFAGVPDISPKSTGEPTAARKAAEALGDDGLSADGRESARIAIKAWDPKTPYIAAMKAVAPEKAYDVYLAQRKAYAGSPAFYLDCADYLTRVNQRAMGIRVLSDIVELELHDARLLRVAAHRFDQMGESELAIDLFEKVLKLRPEEPQSYRDLALALAGRADAVASSLVAGKPVAPLQESQAATDYRESLVLLNKVVTGNWPRFPEVELPVLMEANDIAARAQRMPHIHDFHNPLDPRLQKNLDLDVRVVMTWDADQTDIDLWVTEPSDEKCFYQHNRTVIGGLLSHDFTDGYGPEEYCLRKLMPGKYVIQANYYGSRQQELTGPATVQATVITNFGRPNEQRQSLTLRLKDAKEVVDIGTISLGNGADVTARPAPARER